MAHYQNSMDARPLYQARFIHSKMDPSLRIDEGYSEEARSQDDPDSPMRLDTISEGALLQPWSVPGGIPSQIMALSETERSGKNVKSPWDLVTFGTDQRRW